MNYFYLSEKKDWKGDLTRLVLKDSEYAGLIVVRLKATKSLEEIGNIPDPEEDSLPISAVAEEQDDIDWVEMWEKIYISKNEEWGKMADLLRDFYQDVTHFMDVDAVSEIPMPTISPTIPTILPTIPTVSAPQPQTMLSGPSRENPSKTKGVTAPKVTPGKKRKHVIESLDDEVGRATCLVLCFMQRYMDCNSGVF